MKTFQPFKGDGARTRCVLQSIRLGHIKGRQAHELLQQARVDDARQAIAAEKNAGQP